MGYCGEILDASLVACWRMSTTWMHVLYARIISSIAVAVLGELRYYIVVSQVLAISRFPWLIERDH
jgi:hypothetical protein